MRKSTSIKRIVPLVPKETDDKGSWKPSKNNLHDKVINQSKQKPSTIRVKRDASYADTPLPAKPQHPGSYYIKYRGKDLRLPITAKVK